MVYVILVRRAEGKAPSVYVETGSTPCMVPEGCQRGVKLYTRGHSFELVRGKHERARRTLAENAEEAWGSDTMVENARTRDDGATVQIHAMMV